jgi:hypothetical protein
VKRLTRGLVPPDPPSLCPLSAEFVEPPPKKIPGYATVQDLRDLYRSRSIVTVMQFGLQGWWRRAMHIWKITL